MTSNTVADAEQVIRERLEASGQYGKMRAMIMEAALQVVNAESDDRNSTSVFQPTTALQDAKQHRAVELRVVQEYLDFLGLQYTARVLEMEAGLQKVALPSSEQLRKQLRVESPGDSTDPCLRVLLHSVTNAPASPPFAAPTTVTTPAGETSTAEGKVMVRDVDSEAASDHDQAGGEDSTYFISRWKRRHFLRHNQVSGQQLQIEYLTDCCTVVLDELDSMMVDDCEGGELVIAACEGSVFLRNCKNMTVHVACKQLRTRDCANINLHIFTSTDPVIEMSHHIAFFPFHLRLPGLRRLFAEAHLDAKMNRFVHVYDFTASESSLPMPHFAVHFPDHKLSMEDRYPTQGVPECPPELEALLALQLMPAASSESGKSKSYDIRTGAQVWTQGGAPPAVNTGGGGPAGNETSQSTGEADGDSESSEHLSAKDSSAASLSHSSSSANEGAVPDAKKPAVPATSAATPAVPTTATAVTATHKAQPGGLDNEEYSSFEDEEDEGSDNYEVEEDEDDF